MGDNSGMKTEDREESTFSPSTSMSSTLFSCNDTRVSTISARLNETSSEEDLSVSEGSDRGLPNGPDAVNMLLTEAIRCRQLDVEQSAKLRVSLRNEMMAGRPSDTKGMQAAQRYYMLNNANTLGQRLRDCDDSLSRNFFKLQMRRLCHEIVGMVVDSPCKCLTTAGPERIQSDYEAVIEDNPLKPDSDEELIQKDKATREIIDFNAISTKEMSPFAIGGQSSGVPGPSILRNKSASSPTTQKLAIRFTPGDHPTMDEEQPQEEEEERKTPQKETETESEKPYVVEEPSRDERLKRFVAEITKTEKKIEIPKVRVCDSDRHFITTQYSTDDGRCWRVGDLSSDTKAVSLSDQIYYLRESCIERPGERSALEMRSLLPQRCSRETTVQQLNYWLKRAVNRLELSSVTQWADVQVVTTAPLVVGDKPSDTSQNNRADLKNNRSDQSFTSTESSSECTTSILDAQKSIDSLALRPVTPDTHPEPN